jgi:hypothetical protein
VRPSPTPFADVTENGLGRDLVHCSTSGTDATFQWMDKQLLADYLPSQINRKQPMISQANISPNTS